MANMTQRSGKRLTKLEEEKTERQGRRKKTYFHNSDSFQLAFFGRSPQFPFFIFFNSRMVDRYSPAVIFFLQFCHNSTMWKIIFVYFTFWLCIYLQKMLFGLFCLIGRAEERERERGEKGRV